MVMKMLRTYSELITLPTFEERYNYLRLLGKVGKDTFGFDRIFNQDFYRSTEWKRVRDKVIVRDDGCDLGVKGHEIFGRIYIHHMNPITINDIKDSSRLILDPEFLICTTFETHNAIHYGDGLYLKKFEIVERKPNDTIPWR